MTFIYYIKNQYLIKLIAKLLLVHYLVYYSTGNKCENEKQIVIIRERETEREREREIIVHNFF